MPFNTRIRVPATAAAGEIVEIRAMIMHPMENGFRVDTQGTAIPVNIITDFVCSYDGGDVFRVRLEPGLAANPYFAFFLKATRSGLVEFAWTDQEGVVTTASAPLQVI
jgi:sulfur-oxidizing protein SoxZ